MTIFEICNFCNGIVSNGITNKSFNGDILIDSRKIKNGDIFIAIRGLNLDGHNFVTDAIDNGAMAIIVDKDIETDNKNIVIIKVNDTKKAMILLATKLREKYINIPLIAITGSVGKTTTKELLYEILSTKYKVLKTEGNLNNHFGVPLTLFKLNNKYDIVILELGMNHLGEISLLSNICKPDVAIITNIGTSHIGYLGSKNNIYKAKKEIMHGMKNGYVIINSNDKYLKKIKSKTNAIIQVNQKKKVSSIILTKNNLYFKIKVDNKYHWIMFTIPNKYLIPNILLVIETSRIFLISTECINKILGKYKALDKRSSTIKIKDTLIINDCYNSSYESLIASLEMLNVYEEEKIIVIGDILELGVHNKKIHKKIGKKLKKINSTIILVGNDMKYAYQKGFIYCYDNEEVKRVLDKLDLSKKVLLLKGSRGMKLEEIEEYLKKTLH